MRRVLVDDIGIVTFLVYQIGTLVTTGSLGTGFVPGLIIVAAIAAIIISLIRKADSRTDREYALDRKVAVR